MSDSLEVEFNTSNLSQEHNDENITLGEGEIELQPVESQKSFAEGRAKRTHKARRNGFSPQELHLGISCVA